MGVRLCTSARPRMLLELRNLNLPDFVEGSGQPLTAAWLCFMLKYGCQAPIAANALVGRRQLGITTVYYFISESILLNSSSLPFLKSLIEVSFSKNSFS